MDKLHLLDLRKSKHNKEITVITFGVRSTANVDCELACFSDVHYDSKDCDRALFKEQMDQAMDRGQYQLHLGDMFDAMGSKKDPRTDKRSLRPEYSHINEEKDESYLTKISDDAYKFLAPYKDRMLVLVKGNHEEGIHRHHEYSINNVLASRLRDEAGGVVLPATYRGYIILKFVELDNPKQSLGKHIIYYTHGNGGSAPVTHNVITAARLAEQFDADTYMMGHVHKEWAMTRTMVKVNSNDRMIQNRRLFVQLGTFKRFNMSDPWAAMKGMGPISIGSTTLGIQIRRRKNIRSVASTATRSFVHDFGV